LRSVRYGANLVDSAFGDKGYTKRLMKYASRGFAIASPGYSPDYVRADLFSDRYAYFVHSGLLLRLGRCIWDRNSAMSTHNIMESCKIIPESVRRGIAIQNLAKLIVLDQGAPIVTYHGDNILRANAPVCVPYRTDASTSRGEYIVIEGRALQDKVAVGYNDDDLYVNMIGELVELILRKIRDTTSEDDPWITGGPLRTKNAGQGILCVYDLVKCGSSFDELRWVLDARHAACNLSVATFERRYGLPALIGFSDISLRHKVEDFTLGVYK